MMRVFWQLRSVTTPAGSRNMGEISARQCMQISTPLAWHEVKKGLSPQLFTIETIQQRLVKQPSDPWALIEKNPVDIKKILKKLVTIQA